MIFLLKLFTKNTWNRDSSGLFSYFPYQNDPVDLDLHPDIAPEATPSALSPDCFPAVNGRYLAPQEQNQLVLFFYQQNKKITSLLAAPLCWTTTTRSQSASVLLPRNFLDCRIFSNNCLDQDAPPPGCNALPFWSFWSIIHLFEKLGGAMLQTNWGVHTDSSDILLPSSLWPPSASGSKISKRMFNTSAFPGHRPKSMYLKGVQAHKPSKMPQASGNPKDELPMHRTHHHSTKGFQASFSSVALDIGTTCRDMPWKIFEESRNLVCLIHFG